MPSPRRLEKLNMLLSEEIAKIIDREIDFPDGTLVTITKVITSQDAHYADVFISVLGKDSGDPLEILEKNVYNIQHQLNRRLRIRPIPRIRFKIDEGEIKRLSVEKILLKLKSGEV